MAFQAQTLDNVVKLEAFKSLDEPQLENLDSFAHTIAIASVLSQVSAFAFQQTTSHGEPPPWDHASSYQKICSQLARFDVYFQRFHGGHDFQTNRLCLQHDGIMTFTEPFIFSYILYHLCYCLLQHPFLLRRRIEASGKKPPTKFFSLALDSCFEHAEASSWTLASAKQAGYNVSATMFSYCTTVAGSIHSIFQNSEDEIIRSKAIEALQGSLMHLQGKAEHWKVATRMAGKS
jgi:hypothetical protein